MKIIILKILRKLYAKIFYSTIESKPVCERDPDKVSKIIYKALIENKPSMVARFGAFELATMVNYLGVNEKNKSVYKFITGEQQQWWWNKKLLAHMQDNAGFFPLTEEKIIEFCELMLQDKKQVDVLGSWLANENYFLDKMNCELVQREIQNPFFTDKPWTKALEGKKVLVVHPFDQLIAYQYKNARTKLFKNKDVLPKFELITLPAVQSIGGEHEIYKDWFEALSFMKKQIDVIDYDICLIGAGAYGFSLAAHVKRQGKKSVHLGGSLQLLFGIKGKRWEDPSYNKDYNYAALINEHWVRPGDSLKPANAENVEGACYW